MQERTYATERGAIRYWVNDVDPARKTLVLLPGLTADHRLFDKQVAYFEPRCNVFVWDAPGHAASRPFELTFTLEDKARWLREILAREGIERPVLVGQSMGGYVSQMYMQLFPGEAQAFVSIDSAPLQRPYYNAAEIWLLKHTKTLFWAYPRKALVRQGAEGCSTTEYGRALMRDFIETYDRREYAKLVGHGYRILAGACEANLPYEIDCPALLICGKQDKAASTRRYNRAWTEKAGLRLVWIEDAGHNSNADKPDEVNALIAEFAGV